MLGLQKPAVFDLNQKQEVVTSLDILPKTT